jgi:hypothetical protein
MKNYRQFYILLLVALLTACATSKMVSTTSQDSVNHIQTGGSEDEEHFVYTAIITEMYVNGEPNNDVIVEVQTSLGGSVCDVPWTTNYVSQNMSRSVSKSVFDNFVAKNSDSQASQGQIRTGPGYSIITKGEVDELYQDRDFWDRFSEKYPKGILVTLSRIGFNEEMNQALVYSSHTCGWKCGLGYYVLLMKDGNTWTIKHKVNVWAS